MNVKGIAILGSTGSIGCNTLRVVQSFGAERFRVVALGAGRNVEKLSEQIVLHQPELVSVATEECAAELRERLSGQETSLLPRIVVGEAGLAEVATHARAETVVSAT